MGSNRSNGDADIMNDDGHYRFIGYSWMLSAGQGPTIIMVSRAGGQGGKMCERRESMTVLSLLINCLHPHVHESQVFNSRIPDATDTKSPLTTISAHSLTS